jgi:hypothetical protein
MGACSERKSTGPEVVPGGKIIMIGNRVIQRISENIVPFPNIVLIKWKKREIQDGN